MFDFDKLPGSANTQLLLPTSKANSLESERLGPVVSQLVQQSIAPACPQSQPGVSEISRYVNAAIADNTRRAYRQDLADFLQWGGMVPSTSEAVSAYIADRAQTQTPATLTRRVVGIGRAHVSQGLADPTKSDLVRTVLRGVRRVKGSAQRQVNPLLKHDLLSMLSCVSGVSGTRDRALLLLGFAAALRRSELAALTVQDIEFVREGMVVHLRKSKTDQTAEGRKIGVPLGRHSACPVKSLEQWLACAKINAGPIFRPVTRAGQIGDSQLSAQSIALIIKGYAKQIGLDATKFSGHSLRAGLVTSAIQAGVPVHKVQAQTGHQSVEMSARYIRDAGLFDGNASGALL